MLLVVSSVRRPRMPKPRIPKIKKLTISKSRKLRKTVLTVSSKKPSLKTRSVTIKPSTKRKTPTKKNTGTCYLQLGCRNVLERGVSKSHCKKIGGKSWKKTSGSCERLTE